jgi:hypothetical protein
LAVSAFAVAKAAAAFSAFEPFPLFLWFGFFWWRWFFVFLADFIYAFSDVLFEFFSDEVTFAECVCAGCNCEFACNDTCDLSTLPPFCIMQKGVLED